MLSFPYKLAVRVIQNCTSDRTHSDASKFVGEMQKLHDEYLKLHQKCVELDRENVALKKEVEFLSVDDN